VSRQSFGCQTGSDPVGHDKDERVFLLARSRLRHPGLHVRAAGGWHEVENDAYRWTERRFGLDVLLPASEPAREFALRFFVPEVALESGEIAVRCEIQGEPAGSITCAS